MVPQNVWGAPIKSTGVNARREETLRLKVQSFLNYW
jgi:hypothetical protein